MKRLWRPMIRDFRSQLKGALPFEKLSRITEKIRPKKGFKESDILIASFPKSGRNWVLFLLANTMLRSVGATDSQVTFLNVHELIPEEPTGEPTVRGFPRLIASHDNYVGQQGHVIYLLRHPGDVMVSYYDYLRGRWNRDLGSFSSFIRDSGSGILAWLNHVESWEGRWDILVRYEDLLQDPLAELERMVALLSREVSDDVFKKAVELSSFENMRRIEEEKGLPPKPGANPGYTFVRKGKYGRGEDMFSFDDYRYLHAVADHVMERYGYVDSDVCDR